MSNVAFCTFLLIALVTFAGAAPQCENPDVSFNCTSDADCNFRGNCMPSGECRCEDKYATYNNTTLQCNYKRVNRLLPFLTEFFLGMFGVGYFILGKVGLGVGQLLLFLSLVLSIIIGRNAPRTLNPLWMLPGLLSIIIFLGGFGWWLYAIITIGKGDVLDENGVATYW